MSMMSLMTLQRLTLHILVMQMQAVISNGEPGNNSDAFVNFFFHVLSNVLYGLLFFMFLPSFRKL